MLLALVACARPSADPRLDRVRALVQTGAEKGALEALAPFVAEASRRDVGKPMTLARAYESAAASLEHGTSEAVRDETDRLLRLALASYERGSGAESLDVARVLSALSNASYTAGRYGEAEHAARRCVSIRRARLGRADTATLAAERDLASILLGLGRYGEAGTLTEDSLAVAPAGSVDRAESLNVLGEVRRVQNRYEESVTAFLEAISISEAASAADPLLLPTLCNNLAGVYKDQGDLVRAEAPLARALEMSRQQSPLDESRLATALLNLGDVRRMQGRYEEADRLLAAALIRARAIYPDDSPDLVWFISQLAVLRWEQSRFDEAEAGLRDALSRRERVLAADHPDIAQSAHDLGELLASTSRGVQAASAFEQAAAIRGRAFGADSPEFAVSVVAGTRARWSVTKPNVDGLLDPLNRAIAILEKTPAFPDARVGAYGLRAEILRSAGRRSAAISSLDRAIELSETLRPQAGAGERERAELWRRRLDLLRTAAVWRIDDGDPAAALAVTERARARVFLDQFEAARIEPRSMLPREVRAPLERRESDAKARLAEDQARLAALSSSADLNDSQRRQQTEALTRDLEQATDELTRVGEELRRAATQVEGWPDPTRLFRSSSQLARTLAGRNVALVYLIGAERSFLLVARASGRVSAEPLIIGAIEARTLAIPAGPFSASDLETIVAGPEHGLRSAFTRPGGVTARGFGSIVDAVRSPAMSDTEFYTRLEALAKVLLPVPLRRELAAAGEVVVVPDGLLHLVPFEALVLASPDEHPVFVLDAWPPIRYASSGAVLSVIEQRSSRASVVENDRALLTIADPDLHRRPSETSSTPGATFATSGGWSAILGRLPPLPGARAESDRVAAAWRRRPGAIAIGLAGSDATEAHMRAEAGKAGALHFATHGIASESEASTLAGLVFTSGTTGATEDDGLLQLHEVYDLKLHADIAVLSACSTQIGLRVDGEGVQSLSRAFLAAGADRVVATLWPVDDESVGEIVGAMFEAVTAASRPAPVRYAVALRDAKRRVRIDPAKAHPFYWAAITLVGMD
jgi:CHAT domain-containing protein/tetratricopeptide (TPR) repeat protein